MKHTVRPSHFSAFTRGAAITLPIIAASETLLKNGDMSLSGGVLVALMGVRFMASNFLITPHENYESQAISKAQYRGGMTAMALAACVAMFAQDAGYAHSPITSAFKIAGTILSNATDGVLGPDKPQSIFDCTANPQCTP